MPFDKNTFAATLRAERARRDMSQAELAKRAGVNLATVSQYEDGSFVLGCRVRDLFKE